MDQIKLSIIDKELVMNRFEMSEPLTQEQLSEVLRRGQEMHDKEISEKVYKLVKGITNIFSKRNKMVHHKPAGARA